MMREANEKEYLLSVLARNNPGVLLRIAGLFARRCYNILSIVAAETENAEYSRILIVVSGDDRIVRQVDKQLCKLEDIEEVNVLDRGKAVVREHLLMKVERTPQNGEKLVEIASVFRATLFRSGLDDPGTDRGRRHGQLVHRALHPLPHPQDSAHRLHGHVDLSGAASQHNWFPQGTERKR